jgi:type VI secretion system protein VasD
MEKGRALRIAVFMTSLAASCAHGPSSKPPCDNPPPFSVQLTAGPHLNPDARGRALPTSVTLYQLKSGGRVDPLDFQRLTSSAQEALGDDLLKSQEVVLDPGQTMTFWVPRDGKANHLLVVAFVRQPGGTSWRSGASLPPLESDECAERPQPIPKRAPGKDDVQVKFVVDGYDVRLQGISRPQDARGRSDSTE